MRDQPLSSSPPVGFRVYGLAASWPGSRWLALFDGAIGEPVQGIRLAHRSSDGTAAVLVSSHPRPEREPYTHRCWWAEVREVAFHAAFLLVDMTLPALSVSRPDGLVSGLVDHAQHAAEQYARWPMADWRVDGADVPARVWRFADGWAAIIDVLPDVYLAAAGVGTPVDGIAVATVHDATPYGFDLREPLSMQALRRSESTRPEGAHVPTVREPADWHPDQLAVPRRAHSDDR